MVYPHSNRARIGFTIAEVLVAGFVMGLLLVAIFAIFRMGVVSWQKLNANTELFQSIQVSSAKLSRDAERSVFVSASMDNSGRAVAFLSPLDQDEQFVVRDDGSLEWQKYLVFYRDPSTNEVLVKEVPLHPTAAERMNPGPIENYNDGTGTKAWSTYMSAGQPLARDVTEFTIVLHPDPERLVELTMVAEKMRADGVLERVSLSSVIHFRN